MSPKHQCRRGYPQEEDENFNAHSCDSVDFATTRERVAAVVDPDCTQAGDECEDDCDNCCRRSDVQNIQGLQWGTNLPLLEARRCWTTILYEHRRSK